MLLHSFTGKGGSYEISLGDVFFSPIRKKNGDMVNWPFRIELHVNGRHTDAGLTRWSRDNFVFVRKNNQRRKWEFFGVPAFNRCAEDDEKITKWAALNLPKLAPWLSEYPLKGGGVSIHSPRYHS